MDTKREIFKLNKYYIYFLNHIILHNIFMYHFVNRYNKSINQSINQKKRIVEINKINIKIDFSIISINKNGL